MRHNDDRRCSDWALSGLFGWVVLACLPACVDHVPAGRPPATAEPTPDVNACGTAGESHTVVVTDLRFVPAVDGKTRGLDLDGRVSDRGDTQSCGQVDFEDESGNRGIDNQFARLLPALEAVAGGDSVQAVIQRTINSGNVLLTFELQRLDDPTNDECVEVTVARALGTPVVGGDGWIEPSQTFDRDQDAPITKITDATMVAGRIEAGPFDLVMPMVVDNFDVLIDIQNAYLQAQLNEDGSMQGLIAGAISIPEFVASIENIDASSDVLQLVSRALNNLADMGQDADGKCQQLSISLAIQATPAFFFEDSP